MLNFLLHYLRLILFSGTLLLGIQLPAFVDQYAKRVDAHLLEAKQNLLGFQQTADRYFDGSIDKLLAHYQNSQDEVFRRDADNIAFIHTRVSDLNAEQQALQASSVARAYHVMFAHNYQILNETLDQYSYMILLNPTALLWGVSLAFLLTFAIELLLLGCGKVGKRMGRSTGDP